MQRACGRKARWVLEGKEGSLDDWDVMSEGKRSLEMLAGAGLGSAHQCVRVWWTFSCWQWGAMDSLTQAWPGHMSGC